MQKHADTINIIIFSLLQLLKIENAHIKTIFLSVPKHIYCTRQNRFGLKVLFFFFKDTVKSIFGSAGARTQDFLRVMQTR